MNIDMYRCTVASGEDVTMREAVIIGAGCIGRGFVAQLFHEAGWHVTFLDIDAPLVEALARQGSYTHVTVSNTESVRTTIGPVAAIDAHDEDAAIAAFVAADLAATSVGGTELPDVAPVLAAAIARRIELGRPPLNVLLCENVHRAAGVMRGLLAERLPQVSPDVLDTNLGLLETSIDRTIPVPKESVRAVDPSIIYADPYRPLPYDIAAVRGVVFEVPGIVGDPTVPFAFYGERKLYIHNMGHALTAYLGERAGVALISEAIASPELRRIVRGAMVESATALSHAYGQPMPPLVELVDDLLSRFADRTLPDTVARVGRDPIRKTTPGDRLVGPFVSAVQQHLPSAHLSLAVAVGADALGRHEGWPDDRISRHLGLGKSVLTTAQRELLEAQIALLSQGSDLQQQIDLIEEYEAR